MKFEEDFIHLHIHSTYSVLDGINKIDALCEHVKRNGMSGCALTDHGNLHGMVDFFKEANKVGIKPLIGVEAYLTDDAGDLSKEEMTKDNYHAILIAQNDKGLANIISMMNQANSRNFYYKPRISFENLYNSQEGVVLSTACLGGVIAKQGNVGAGRSSKEKKRPWALHEKEAEAKIMEMRSYFGDRFYLEVQDNDMVEQDILNAFLVKIGRAHKIPLVITADAHYLTHRDHHTHKMIMAKQFGQTLKEYDAGEVMKYGEKFYVRPPKEMYEAACKIGDVEAFFNTAEIAERCNVSITLGEYQAPEFNVAGADDYKEFKAWEAGCSQR